MIISIVTATADLLTVGGVTLNLTDRVAMIGDSRINLTGKEYALLELLALRAGDVLSKADMMDHLYEPGKEPEVKILDVFICKMRRKLRLAGVDPIETVWARGYVIPASDALAA